MPLRASDSVRGISNDYLLNHVLANLVMDLKLRFRFRSNSLNTILYDHYPNKQDRILADNF